MRTKFWLWDGAGLSSLIAITALSACGGGGDYAAPTAPAPVPAASAASVALAINRQTSDVSGYAVDAATGAMLIAHLPR